MSDHDLAISVAPMPPVGAISKKPPHLLIVESYEGKNKPSIRFFISLDKPASEVGFVNVKGFFLDSTEEIISKSYNEFIVKTPKDLYEEIMFPYNKIVRIKNLVFKAK